MKWFKSTSGWKRSLDRRLCKMKLRQSLSSSDKAWFRQILAMKRYEWMKLREAFQTKKLRIFLKRNVPLKILRNKLNMKNIGTKSIKMSYIRAYLAMFSTIIDKILCFWVLIRWKWVIFTVSDTLWNLGLFGTIWKILVHNQSILGI